MDEAEAEKEGKRKGIGSIYLGGGKNVKRSGGTEGFGAAALKFQFLLIVK